MTFTEAALEVLRSAGEPLHYKKITELAIAGNLLSHVGKTPEVTMSSRLATLVKKDRGQSPIIKVRPGVFALRESAMVLYRIEAPMDQALAMADVLVKACERLSMLLGHLREFKDLDKHWIEIHRLENDGDRLFREAFASLFAGGIDPMVVIRWRDIFLRLERAIDATEHAATVVQTIATKYG